MKKILIFILSIFLIYSCANKSIDGNMPPVERKMSQNEKKRLENIEREYEYSEEIVDENLIFKEEDPYKEEESYDELFYDDDGDGVPDIEDVDPLTPTPPPPVPSPPSPTPAPLDITEGDINYVLNDTMIVGIINEINMTISTNVNRERIISEIETFTDDNLHSESIRISPVMKARLTDPSGINFKIIPRTSEEQFLENGDYTRWTWDVTPLNKGNNSLNLVVDIIIGDKSKSIQVFDGEIYVYSDTTFTEKILIFLNENWKYLLSSLIIPFLIFLYKRRTDKKKK